MNTIMSLGGHKDRTAISVPPDVLHRIANPRQAAPDDDPFRTRQMDGYPNPQWARHHERKSKDDGGHSDESDGNCDHPRIAPCHRRQDETDHHHREHIQRIHVVPIATAQRVYPQTYGR